ncbi:MAG: hypothetical protein ACUVQ1_00930 [Candidatus Kapaibacteriales bacterium]
MKWIILLPIYTLITIFEAHSIGISIDGGITFPYETTIVGSISQLLEKNGLSLSEDADYGNPDRIGLGFNANVKFFLTSNIQLTSSIGYWVYDNLNDFGLFTLKTIPLNLGLQYDYPLGVLRGFVGFEHLFFYNISNISSNIMIGDKQYNVSFSDKLNLFGIAPIFGFSFPILANLQVETYHKLALIFRKKYKNLLYFNVFLGFRYYI